MSGYIYCKNDVNKHAFRTISSLFSTNENVCLSKDDFTPRASPWTKNVKFSFRFQNGLSLIDSQ